MHSSWKSHAFVTCCYNFKSCFKFCHLYQNSGSLRYAYSQGYVRSRKVYSDFPQLTIYNKIFLMKMPLAGARGFFFLFGGTWAEKGWEPLIFTTVKLGYDEQAWDRPIEFVITVIRYNREDLNYAFGPDFLIFFLIFLVSHSLSLTLSVFFLYFPLSISRKHKQEHKWLCLVYREYSRRRKVLRWLFPWLITFGKPRSTWMIQPRTIESHLNWIKKNYNKIKCKKYVFSKKCFT